MKLSNLILAIATAASIALPGLEASASSHREAPYITKIPKVDGTDFYMFTSYEAGRSDYVTLVADYIPLQDPAGGPYFYMMDPNALYEIHIDNNGDAKEDLTFQFRFTNTLKDTKLTVGGRPVSIPVLNSGPISTGNTAALDITESYSVTVVRGNRRGGASTRQSITNADGGNANGGNATFAKPVDNIGNKSIPDYPAYAASHVYNINIPGCTGVGRMFVGQRKDPFVVNVGEIFDLINTNPLGPVNGEADDLAKKNVTSLELEIPKSCLVSSSGPIIGGWTTASVRQARVLRTGPDYGTSSKEGGPWMQVSRLSMPLVNEVVIGTKDKDRFNGSRPENDARFAEYVTNPTLPALIEILYPSAPAPTNFPRNDLVAVFLTGVPGVNQPTGSGVVPAEMMRLNTSTPPTLAAAQNNLGVIGGDNAGYPNGRRPGDDVVDISLRVVMGKLCKLSIGCVPADAPAGDAAFTDGAFVDSTFFDNAFPYLRNPLPGSPN